MAESELDRAERHVREDEARVARQERLVDRMERVGDAATIELARELLAIMQDALDTSRAHLEAFAATGVRFKLRGVA